VNGIADDAKMKTPQSCQQLPRAATTRSLLLYLLMSDTNYAAGSVHSLLPAASTCSGSGWM
jgi:hypothetical protein